MKKKNKQRNKNEILATHISETAGAISSNLVCGVAYLVCTSVVKLHGSNQMRDHGATKV